MSDTVSRDEHARLEGRVAALEEEVEGEKLVTRHVLEQARRNGDDLAAVSTRLERIETDLGELKAELESLRADLPRLVADALRSVLRERGGG